MSAGRVPDLQEGICLIPKESFDGAFRKSMLASAVVGGAMAMNPALAQNAAGTGVHDLSPVTVQEIGRAHV